MKKFLPVILAGLLILSGCNSQQLPTSNQTVDSIEFPLEQPVTLTYWANLGGSVGLIQNMNEIGSYKVLEQLTGVKIDFKHPVAGSEREQFNIMIASGEYPDILEGVSQYTGGYPKAFEDGIIYDLKELQEKYAPNITRIYEKYPFLLPYIESEDGHYFALPSLRGGEILRQASGPIFRADWLDELGLKTPVTIDDWTAVLTEFKEKKSSGQPLLIFAEKSIKGGAGVEDIRGLPIIGAYGIAFDYFLENGKVLYGPYDLRYRDYLVQLKRWYDHGILDKEFGTIDSRVKNSRILGGQVGAYVGAMGSGFGKLLTLKDESDSPDTFNLRAVPYPVLKEGEPQIMAQLLSTVSNLSVTISKTSKHPEIAMKWLDFAYSREGHLAFNFGIEGESYTMVDGKPVFTELITNNPDGEAMSDMGRRYARSFSIGPFIQDTEYGNQFFSMPEQKQALATWTVYQKQASEVPGGIRVRGTFTPDENAAFSSKQTDIDTYVGENFMKFIIGARPLSEFDAYIDQLKKMGIEDAIKIKQTAHDRFTKRFPNDKIPYDFDVSSGIIDGQ